MGRKNIQSLYTFVDFPWLAPRQPLQLSILCGQIEIPHCIEVKASEEVNASGSATEADQPEAKKLGAEVARLLHMQPLVHQGK